jgi:hypothetical protein
MQGLLGFADLNGKSKNLPESDMAQRSARFVCRIDPFSEHY